ncbi:MAG: hypothetical protein KC766_16280 [Myxococcales bacterium]|nr:hypothetical protein [Myxococcales bacterium]
MQLRPATVLLLLGLSPACGGDDDRLSGSPDMTSEADASSRADAPPPQTSHRQKTCQSARSWSSGRITVSTSPGLTSALQPWFEKATIELRDQVERGCDWKLQLRSATGSASSWVPMHHGATSFWSTGAQETLSLELLDADSQRLSLELSDLTTSARHAGDCGDLTQVDVRGSLGDENDETRFNTRDGDEIRLGDLVETALDRQLTLSFAATPLE